MLQENNRAFKEWAVVCAALASGRQIVLLRKGGIHEEDGAFRVSDTEFFLMPTYEHQNADLLAPEAIRDLECIQSAGYDARIVTLESYAVVHSVGQAASEEALYRLSDHHIWNDRYIRTRLDFNPYDPLFVIVLRVYRLPQPFVLPMQSRYGGCKSWVTLERMLPTSGAAPVLDDREFHHRSELVRRTLGL
ncbi:MAG: DUF1802 family protein [Chthonomonadales bacterium]